MKHCARSMAFRIWKILQVFSDLTGDLYYTKDLLSFISCIPVKTELQCWLFFSVLFTAVISHSEGKYLFPWVKMPKPCKSDFQTVFKIAMFYHCKSLS